MDVIRAAKIAAAKKLIQDLTEAEESVNRRMDIISGEIDLLRRSDVKDLYLNSRLRMLMKKLQNEIGCMEKLVHHPRHKEKELAEPFQKLGYRLHHSGIKNLSMERMTIGELQIQIQRGHEELVHVDEPSVNVQFKTCSKFEYSTQQLKNIIKEWAEKVVYLGNAILCESHNSKVSWQGYNELAGSCHTLYHTQLVELDADKAKFKRCWDSMKDHEKLVKQVRVRLMKECKRSTEREDTLKKINGERLKMSELKRTRTRQEGRDIRFRKVDALKLLFELQQQEEKSEKEDINESYISM